MLTLELLEITETMVKYKYYPEALKEYGIIMIDRMSEERKVEKEVTGYGSNYLAHAFRRIKEYIKNGNFHLVDCGLVFVKYLC